jgi:hypothetical protein
MYDTGAANGEKTSREQKVTARTQAKPLTTVRKKPIPNESPSLRPYQAVYLTLFKCRAD